MASQSDGGSIFVTPVVASIALRAGLRTRRAFGGGDGISSRASSSISVFTARGDVEVSVFIVATLFRFCAGSPISSMSSNVGLVSSVAVKANLAKADLVTRLGGEVGFFTRSNSFEASFDILDERILSKFGYCAVKLGYCKLNSSRDSSWNPLGK
jgi:hypothetical protein